MREATIGDWTPSQLARFIALQLQVDPSALPSSLTLEQVRATKKLTIDGDLVISPQALAYLISIGL